MCFTNSDSVTLSAGIGGIPSTTLVVYILLLEFIPKVKCLQNIKWVWMVETSHLCSVTIIVSQQLVRGKFPAINFPRTKLSGKNRR